MHTDEGRQGLSREMYDRMRSHENTEQFAFYLDMRKPLQVYHSTRLISAALIGLLKHGPSHR